MLKCPLLGQLFQQPLVADILRLRPVWPIIDLAGKVGARLVREELRDVHGVLIGQDTAMPPESLGLNAHRPVVFAKAAAL